MVKVSDVRMSFGSHVIFDEVKFNINRGERIGLIGRNGSGKTTLFNLIIGTLKPDGGTISTPKNYRIGGISQQLTFLKQTVLAEACTALHGERIEDIWWVEKVLAGLGFTERDLSKHPEELSGGFQVRLNLAKALIKEPDLLLLDEPNNFLDILSIRWLIRFLRSWGGEFILITHDRGFMDSVVTHTMIIHRGKVRKLGGGTEKLYKQILKEEEIYEKTRLNVEKRQKEVELFINRFRAKARLAGLVQSRIKTLQKQEEQQKLKKLKTIDFSFNAAPSPSKYPMHVEHLSFSYGQQYPLLIKDFSVTIAREDRIGVIGKNGKGKSTLLRLLAGELVPLQGIITSHPGLSIGFAGSYADFLQKTGWENEGLQTARAEPRSPSPFRSSRSDLRRRRAELINERSRVISAVQEKIVGIETMIHSTEEQLDKNNSMIIIASERGSGEEIQMLSKENHSLKNRLSDLYEKLEDALREKEQREAVFDRKLEELSRN